MTKDETQKLAEAQKLAASKGFEAGRLRKWCGYCNQHGHDTNDHWCHVPLERRGQALQALQTPDEARTRELENDVARLRERLVECNQGWSNALDAFERVTESVRGTGDVAPLVQLARAEGFTLVVDPDAADRPDILGTPQRDELCAQACKGNVIAIRPSLPMRDAFYAVSHEIAEYRLDFTGHHQAVWREQCAILSRWCRRLSLEAAR